MSTVIQRAVLYGGDLTEEVVEAQQITPGMVRFSAGIENTEDLVADVERALDGVARGA